MNGGAPGVPAKARIALANSITPGLNSNVARPVVALQPPSVRNHMGGGGGASQPLLMRPPPPPPPSAPASTSGQPATASRPITLPAMAAGRNIVINQPGLRPGHPGSQITVPLQTLQGLQPGQGIPTGQAGHLLVKTENGQYQILRVGTANTATGAVVTQTSANFRPTAAAGGVAVASAGGGSFAAPTNTAVRPTVSATRPAVSTTSAVVASAAAATGSTPTPSPASTPSAPTGGGGGMGQQMTPDTAKLKCKNFLATLLRLASEQPPLVAANVRNLIQGLIDGKVEPEVFTTKLQKELNSSPQPCLVPFLKKSLPFLQQSLRSGEITIEGVQVPAHRSTATAMGPPPPRPLGMSQRPSVLSNNSNSGIGNAVRPNLLSGSSSMPPPPSPLGHLKSGKNALPSSSKFNSASALNKKLMSSSLSSSLSTSSSSSFSTTGDEDINDVAAMGGVNLAEESQRMQASTSSDSSVSLLRSCKDETFIQTGRLQLRVAKLCRAQGLQSPSNDVLELISHATEARLRTMAEKLSVIAEHRMDVVRLESNEDRYEVVQDVKGQLKFLSDLERIERRRHEEAERDILLRAAKSRTKSEDPERERLKARAREMQRLEEEQMRHEKANNTALLAIGGPKKKLRLEEQVGGAMKSFGTMMNASNANVGRPRTKRVHRRDLLLLMEQEAHLKRSQQLWKAYVS